MLLHRKAHAFAVRSALSVVAVALSLRPVSAQPVPETPPKPVVSLDAKRQVFALLIGSNRGGVGQADLAFATQDAERFRELLMSQREAAPARTYHPRVCRPSPIVNSPLPSLRPCMLSACRPQCSDVPWDSPVNAPSQSRKSVCPQPQSCNGFFVEVPCVPKLFQGN